MTRVPAVVAVPERGRVAGTGPAGEGWAISGLDLWRSTTKIVGYISGTPPWKALKGWARLREFAAGFWWGFCHPGLALREAWNTSAETDRTHR
ncbi:hypothetical protein TPA0907_45700 [Micromonospora humidisoli]|nr:hypothetical protein TPA0907_45700 [Micromonospora sp. AKA109]